MEGTKYLKLFDTQSNYNAYINGSEVYLPNVSLTLDDDAVHYNPLPPHDYSQDYLTFNVLSSGNIVWRPISGETIQYSKNDGNWTNLTSNSTLSVSNGDKVKFKGTINNPNYGFSATTSSYNIEGNIMSLIGGDNFQTLSTAKEFGHLFRGTNVINAEHLVLPATTLANYCYSNMFANCALLETTPETLPVANTTQCFAQMFQNCVSITKGPKLPATYVGWQSYYFMFDGCTNLKEAPELPAVDLYQYSYNGMFQDCTSLTEAPSLPATSMKNWCYANMFKGCTSLIKAPDLPSARPRQNSYYCMFSGCTNLNYVKCLATNISDSSCTYKWMDGVAPTGTFVKKSSMSSWTTGVDGIPNGWTVENE